MFCPTCGNELPGGSTSCPRCGAGSVPVRPAPQPMAQTQPKQRSVYVLLGALLGFVGFPGIHNLYLGRTGRGVAQLLLSVLTCWILWIFMYIWTIVEVCTELKDAEGNPLV